MPDKNLTDAEIIKALEICSKYTGFKDCEKCPLKPNCGTNVLEALALDIITRQKAEIEKLKTEIALLKGAKKIRVPKMKLDEFDVTIECEEYIPLWQAAKIEAYKEFAERLKKALYSDSCRLVFDSDLDIFECAIDNLLKEMVGENDANEKAKE